MTPNFFAFRLRKDKDNYYQVNAAGEVVMVGPPLDKSIAQPAYDITGPGGWNENGIYYNRHPKLQGVLRGFSNTLLFVQAGAQIVRHVLINEGTTGVLQIETLIRNNDTWLYEDFTIGDVDFSTAVPRYTTNEQGIECKLKERGPVATYMANENIPYEISFPPLTSKYALLDGYLLQGRYNFTPIGDLKFRVGEDGAKARIIPTSFSIQEGNYNVAVAQGQSLAYITITNGTTIAEQATFDDATYISGIPQSVTFDFKAKVKYENLSSNLLQNRLNFRMVQANKDKVIIGGATLYQSAPVAPGGELIFDIDVKRAAFNMDAGDRIYLVMFTTSSSAGEQSDVTFTANPIDGFVYQYNFYTRFKLPASAAPYKRYNEAIREVWAMASDSKYGIVSTLLDTPGLNLVDQTPADVVMTCGDAIRGLGSVNKPVKMALSIGDCVTDLCNRLGAGGGVEGDNLRVELLPYFFQDVEICDLGEVTDFVYPMDVARQFNKLYTGMQNQQYDKLNGKDEFNTEHIYKAPMDAVPAELDLKSPFRYDQSGIEQIRGELRRQDTTDNKADQDVFLLEISSAVTGATVGIRLPDGTTQVANVAANLLKRKNNSTNTTGVIDPDGAFNVALTPGRDFERNQSNIASRIYPQRIGAITFQTSEKNQDLISNLGYGEIVENDGRVLPLNVPLITKPYLLQFTAPVPSDFHIRMNANPYGYVSFSFLGVRYKGHVNKAAIRDAEKLTFDFELIAHKSFDETTLPKFA